MGIEEDEECNARGVEAPDLSDEDEVVRSDVVGLVGGDISWTDGTLLRLLAAIWIDPGRGNDGGSSSSSSCTPSSLSISLFDDLASLILRKLSLLLTLTPLPGSSLDVDAVDGSGPLSQLLATASIAIGCQLAGRIARISQHRSWTWH